VVKNHVSQVARISKTSICLVVIFKSKILQDEEMFLSIMKSFKMKIQELVWKNPERGMQMKIH